MGSLELKKARIYEKENEKLISRDERPAFHFSVRTGWLNDPNGFSYYKDAFHMFYQYHPYSTVWGPMHWGHAVSKDLLHWEYLPVAMAPDTSYDYAGCFSGSAIELPNGHQLLMYTGVEKEEQEDGSQREVQTQCIAVGDGINYTKYHKNPVLTCKDVPDGGSRFDFRDPRIWKEEDTYYSLVANRAADDSGQLLLYSSKDGFEWKFENIFAKNENRYGTMWECPDFFELDEKGVVITSPQDMLPQGNEYRGGNATVCIIGEYDARKHELIEQKIHSVDYGIDFYAPQTVLAPDGRRIMIGWMQNPDTINFRTNESKLWFGQMSLPRELNIKDGRLYQKPIRELEQYRKNKVMYEDVLVENIISLDGIAGRKVDMEIEISSENEKKMFQDFTLYLAQDKEYYTAVTYQPYESILEIDRKYSGSRRSIIHQCRCQVTAKNNVLKLRIILDKFSVEVFANDGEKVMTATIYTNQEAKGISFGAAGKVKMKVVKYDLDI